MNKLMMVAVGAALSVAVAGAYAADDMKKGSTKAGSSMSKGSSASSAAGASDASKDAAPKKGRAARKAKG